MNKELINNCKEETIKHINNVEKYIDICIDELVERTIDHDKTKLTSPELEVFAEYTPKLKNSTYGSEEYKQFLKEMNVALIHHYSHNRHHPEHFRDGIKGMNLIDIVEMLCDWKSATLRHDDGDLLKSIEINQSRFNYSNELKQIFLNTAKLLYKYHVQFGCCDGRKGLYLADTVENLHEKIDKDEQLDEVEKRILKRGYFREFEHGEYKNTRYCIDNGFDVSWEVN